MKSKDEIDLSKEITKAKGIISEWIKHAETYKARFVLLKKNRLAPLKAVVLTLQNQAKERDSLITHETLLSLDHTKEKLLAIQGEGERLFDELNTWKLGAPRRGLEDIAKELKLGQSDSHPYIVVRDAVKFALTEVADEIRSAEAAWKQDLQIALQNHLDALSTVEKIFHKEKRVNEAFLTQFVSAVKRFAEEAAKMPNEKIGNYVRYIDEIANGKMATKEKYIRENLYKLTITNYDGILKTRSILKKNYERVLKIIPKEILDSLPAQNLQHQLSSAREKAEKCLAYEEMVYGKLKAGFETLEKELEEKEKKGKKK